MHEFQILEEEEFIKMNRRVLLWNPTDETIEMKFDGRPYNLSPNQVMRVRENVARCLINDFGMYGVVQIASTEPEEMEEKRRVGLLNLYEFLFDQLRNYVNWISDQKQRGQEVLGEPIRLKELKVLIAEFEERLNLPKRMNSNVYEELKEDKEQILALRRKPKANNDQAFSPEPLQPKNEKVKGKKFSNPVPAEAMASV